MKSGYEDDIYKKMLIDLIAAFENYNRDLVMFQRLYHYNICDFDDKDEISLLYSLSTFNNSIPDKLDITNHLLRILNSSQEEQEAKSILSDFLKLYNDLDEKLTIRDVLEGSIDQIKSRASGFNIDILMSYGTTPLWPILIPIGTALHSHKFPDQVFSDQVRKILSGNAITALENECVIYKRQLIYEKNEIQNKIESQKHKGKNKEQKINDKTNAMNVKLNNLNEKIKSLDDLIATLEDNEVEKTNEKIHKKDKEKIIENERNKTKAKIKAFYVEFSKIENNKVHPLAGDDGKLKLWRNAILHILASAITLGSYSVLKAKYSNDTRHTIKFWRSQNSNFKANVKSRLKKENLKKRSR